MLGSPNSGHPQTETQRLKLNEVPYGNVLPKSPLVKKDDKQDQRAHRPQTRLDLQMGLGLKAKDVWQ